MPDWDGLKLVLDHTDYALIGKCDAENGAPARAHEHPPEFRKAYQDGYDQGRYFLPRLEALPDPRPLT